MDLSGFRPGVALTLTVLVALTILVSLGTWQIQRSAWKTDLIATLRSKADAPAATFRDPMTVTADDRFGRFRMTGTIRDDVPPQRYRAVGRLGVPGHHVLVVLELSDRPDRVLVDLGWIAADAFDGFRSFSGPIELEGAMIWLPEARSGPFTPANEPANAMWYWLDQPALEAGFGLALAPTAFRAVEVSPALGPVPQPLSVDLPNNHFGYAITWYGLAAGLIAIYVAYGLQRGREVS